MDCGLPTSVLSRFFGGKLFHFLFLDGDDGGRNGWMHEVKGVKREK